MLLEDMGNVIKTYRQRLGFTQNDLASALQVSPQAVSKWERGENAPDVTILPNLSEVLGASVDTLLCSNWRDKRTVEATVVYADMEGFGPLVKSCSAADLAIALNAFFYPLTEHMIAHDGVPIKYEGDELLCFFSGDGHRLRAFEAVFAAKAVSPRPLRFSVSSGPVWMGSLGHPLFARPDILGEPLNQASVLHEWIRTGAPSKVGATEEALKGLEGRLRLGAAGTVSPWSSSEPVKVREVLGLA